MTIKNLLSIAIAFFLIAGCANTGIQTEILKEKKTAKIYIVSTQKNLRLEFRSNGQMGLLPALVEAGIQSAAANNAEPAAQAFQSRNVSTELVDSIKQYIQQFSSIKIDEVVIVNEPRYFYVKNELEDCKSDLLIVVSASTSMLPEQNVIQIATTTNIYDKKLQARPEKMPIAALTISAEIQSVVYGIAYPQSTALTVPKTPEKAAAELVFIERRFNEQIEKNPAKKDELEKQRAKEIMLAKNTKTTVEVHPSAIEALTKNNNQLFNDIYDDLIENAGLATLAGLETAWSVDIAHRRNSKVLRRRSGDNFQTFSSEGYIIDRPSKNNRILFRTLSMLIPDSHIQIVSYPKSNGAIFIGGN